MSENTKRTILYVLLFAFFTILFNVVFFFCVTNYTTTRWIGYTGITLAYIFFIITCFSIPDAKGGAVYGYPKIYIGFSTFLGEFSTGLLFILVNNDSFIFPLIVQIIIISIGVGSYIILTLTVLTLISMIMSSWNRSAADRSGKSFRSSMITSMKENH